MSQTQSKTVLVTGGTGFIAGWCIAKLLQDGWTVRTTVRSVAREAALRASLAKVVEPQALRRLQFAVADLTDDRGWDASVKGC